MDAAQPSPIVRSAEERTIVDLFPEALVNAIGRDYLEQIPTIRGITAVSFENMSEFGAMKGFTKVGEPFVAFVVRNPNYVSVKRNYSWGLDSGHPLEEMIITLVQTTVLASVAQSMFPGLPTKDPKQVFFQLHYTKDCSGASWDKIQKLADWIRIGHFTHLPTDDSRLISSAAPLQQAQYDAIREIFEGRHKDLQRATHFSHSIEDRLRRKEQILMFEPDEATRNRIIDACRVEWSQ